MRVFRERNGAGFWRTRVSGAAPEHSNRKPRAKKAKRVGTIVGFNLRKKTEPEPPAIAMARALERRVGNGGGMRDPLPDRELRDGYVTTAVSREVKRWAQRHADARGLARGAFLGLIIESVRKMSGDEIDDLISR